MATGNALSAGSVADHEVSESSVRSLDGDARSASPDAAVDARSEPTPAPRRGVWVLIAALTCPCHLPVYVALLSGTAPGTLLSDNLAVAALVLGVAFMGSLVVFLRAR